jgi:Ser/Thr protein kinase RdoA (MazF antagonist)
MEPKKLHPDRQYPVSRETLTRVLAHYEIHKFSFEQLHNGIANTTVRIESGSSSYVLRVYRQMRKVDADIALELEFQDFLRERGIPIPVIFKNTKGEELTLHREGGLMWQAVLMSFVDGTTRTPYTPELISELAQLQVQMHHSGMEFASKHPSTAHWNDLHLAHTPSASSTYESEVRAFIERLRSFRYPLEEELPYGYNHLDLDLYGNIAIKNNRISGIFDFDDLEYSPLIVCLGNTLWDVLFDHSEAFMWKYLADYQDRRKLTANEREVLPTVVQFRNYAVASDCFLVGKHLSEVPKFMEFEEKIPEIFECAQKW